MCGIVGAIARRNIVPILTEGLKRLEYRGYDSAGLAALYNGGLAINRAVGRISNLEASLDGRGADSTLGIAHTRWATHGRPSNENAHPHTDCSGRFAIIRSMSVESSGPFQALLFVSTTQAVPSGIRFIIAAVPGNEPVRHHDPFVSVALQPTGA